MHRHPLMIKKIPELAEEIFLSGLVNMYKSVFLFSSSTQPTGPYGFTLTLTICHVAQTNLEVRQCRPGWS